MSILYPEMLFSLKNEFPYSHATTTSKSALENITTCDNSIEFVVSTLDEHGAPVGDGDFNT